jgi:hypothetical protein
MKSLLKTIEEMKLNPEDKYIFFFKKIPSVELYSIKDGISYEYNKKYKMFNILFREDSKKSKFIKYDWYYNDYSSVLNQMSVINNDKNLALLNLKYEDSNNPQVTYFIRYYCKEVIRGNKAYLIRIEE